MVLSNLLKTKIQMNALMKNTIYIFLNFSDCKVRKVQIVPTLCNLYFLVIQDKTDAEKMYKFYIKVESSEYSHETMMELLALTVYTCTITYTMKNQQN